MPRTTIDAHSRHEWNGTTDYAANEHDPDEQPHDAIELRWLAAR